MVTRQRGDSSGSDDGTTSTSWSTIKQHQQSNGIKKSKSSKNKKNSNNSSSRSNVLSPAVDILGLAENQDPLDYLQKMERDLKKLKGGKTKNKKNKNAQQMTKKQQQRHREELELKARRKAEKRDHDIEKNAITTIEFSNDVNLQRSKEEKRKKTQQQEQRHRTAQDVAANLNGDATSEAISRANKTYPSETRLQLKDMSGWLESKFTSVQWQHSYKTEEPLLFLNQECREALDTWLKTLEPRVFEEMTLFLMKLIFSEFGDEKRLGANIGLKMMLQMLIRRRPDIFVRTLESLIKEKWCMAGRPLQNLFWLLEQVSNVKNLHPSPAIRSWSSVFVDALENVKLSSDTKEQIAKFMESTLRNISKKNNGNLYELHVEHREPPVSGETFFKLQRLAFGERQQQSYMHVYNCFVDLSVFYGPQSVNRHFGAMLSLAGSPKASKEQRFENLRLLLRALTTTAADQEGGCFERWNKMFKHSIAGSSELVQFIHYSVEQNPDLATPSFKDRVLELVERQSNDPEIPLDCKHRMSILEQSISHLRGNAPKVIAGGLALVLAILLMVLFFALSLSYVCYPPSDDVILHRPHWSKKVEQLQNNEQFQSICDGIPTFMRNLFDEDKPLRRMARQT